MTANGLLIPCGPDVPLMLARLWLHLSWDRLPARWLAAYQSADGDAMTAAEFEVVQLASADARMACVAEPVRTRVVGSALRLARQSRLLAAERLAHAS